MEARCSEGAIWLIGHPFPLFRWGSYYAPENGKYWGWRDREQMRTVSRRKVGSVAVLETRATANIVCFGRLGRHNRILERRGIPRVTTYPSKVKFRFGDGSLGGGTPRGRYSSGGRQK